jgi:hypothetical protein
MIDEARQEVKRIYEKLHADVIKLEDECRQTERQRDSLLSDLLNLANDVVQKVERNQTRAKTFQFSDSLHTAAPEFALPPNLEAALRDTSLEGPTQAIPASAIPPVAEPQGSFFDTI